MNVKNLIAGALYDFAGFLTTRKAVLVCSEVHDAAPMAEAVAEFLARRGLNGAEVEPRVQNWNEGVSSPDALAEIRRAYVETFGYLTEDPTAASICETIRDVGGTADLVRELDVALNGEAGARGCSLSELVVQVQSQASVRILNLSDGMRVNFRAPDGERATMFVQTVAEGCDPAVRAAMLGAIADYPVQGCLPTLDKAPE